jgi:hypothetical protein
MLSLDVHDTDDDEGDYYELVKHKSKAILTETKEEDGESLLEASSSLRGGRVADAVSAADRRSSSSVPNLPNTPVAPNPNPAASASTGGQEGKDSAGAAKSKKQAKGEKKAKKAPNVPESYHDHGVFNESYYIKDPNFDLIQFCFDVMHTLSGIIERFIELLAGDRSKVDDPTVKYCKDRDIFPQATVAEKAKRVIGWQLNDEDVIMFEQSIPLANFSTGPRSENNVDGLFTNTSRLRMVQKMKLMIVHFETLIARSKLPFVYKILYCRFAHLFTRILQTVIYPKHIDVLFKHVINAVALWELLHLPSECIFMFHELIHLVCDCCVFGPLRCMSSAIGESLLSVPKNVMPQGGQNMMKTFFNRMFEYEECKMDATLNADIEKLIGNDALILPDGSSLKVVNMESIRDATKFCVFAAVNESNSTSTFEVKQLYITDQACFLPSPKQTSSRPITFSKRASHSLMMTLTSEAYIAGVKSCRNKLPITSIVRQSILLRFMCFYESFCSMEECINMAMTMGGLVSSSVEDICSHSVWEDLNRRLSDYHSRASSSSTSAATTATAMSTTSTLLSHFFRDSTISTFCELFCAFFGGIGNLSNILTDVNILMNAVDDLFQSAYLVFSSMISLVSVDSPSFFDLLNATSVTIGMVIEVYFSGDDSLLKSDLFEFNRIFSKLHYTGLDWYSDTVANGCMINSRKVIEPDTITSEYFAAHWHHDRDIEAWAFYDYVEMDLKHLTPLSYPKHSSNDFLFKVKKQKVFGQWNYFLRTTDIIHDDNLAKDPKLGVIASSSCFHHTRYNLCCEDVFKIDLAQQCFNHFHFVAVKRLKTAAGIYAYDLQGRVFDRMGQWKNQGNLSSQSLPFVSTAPLSSVAYLTTLYSYPERLNIATDFWTDILDEID